MPWRGAQHSGDFPSLGWDLLDWWSEHLASPRDENEPLVFTNEQALLLAEWYRIDERTGRYVYRRGVSRRSKGIGKSPLEAAKVIAEFCGPVRFDGWDAKGNPIGRPWGFKNDPAPWVQVAAVSEDQTMNTWSVVHYFLSQANGGRAADELKIDAGLTRCFLIGRPGRMEPVTASAGSREGQPITYGALDESHLWTTSNGGVRLANTLRRNVAKMNGRTYETTNAFVPGANSVAERTHKAIAKGEGSIFVDAVEAPEVEPTDSDEDLKIALKVAYGDAWWVDLDRIVAEIRDPDTEWEDAERFFFNHNKASGDCPFDIGLWDQLVDRERVVPDGAFIGLGFDGSISQDRTVLMGCTRDGFLFKLGAWQRKITDPPTWTVPRHEVHDAVREAFAKYRVGCMNCDPPRWHSEVEAWAMEYGDKVVLSLDTNSTKRFAPECDRFATTIRERGLTHDGNPELRAALAACSKKRVRLSDDEEDGRSKYVIIKADARKIDDAVAAVLALGAAMSMPETVEPEVFGAFA